MNRNPHSFSTFVASVAICLSCVALADQPKKDQPEAAKGGPKDSPEAVSQRTGPRDGTVPKPKGTADGEAVKRSGARDGEGTPKAGPKDNPNASKPERGGDAVPAVAAAPAQALLKTKEGKVFAAYDKDQSGGVTAEEIVAMRSQDFNRRDVRKLEEVIKQFDSDGDSKTLSVEEFIRWRQSGSPLAGSRR
jgi:hypothetical protein